MSYTLGPHRSEHGRRLRRTKGRPNPLFIVCPHLSRLQSGRPRVVTHGLPMASARHGEGVYRGRNYRADFSHYLRGKAATRLAAAGCTDAEIATITGHSLRDVGAICPRRGAPPRSRTGPGPDREFEKILPSGSASSGEAGREEACRRRARSARRHATANGTSRKASPCCRCRPNRPNRTRPRMSGKFSARTNSPTAALTAARRS